MNLITKILVGVDGSENSEKALVFALEIAEKFSSSVHILNVYQPPPESGYQLNSLQIPATAYPQEQPGYPSITVSSERDLRKLHETILSRVTEKATKLKPAIKISSVLRDGDVPLQIVETAERGQFDLIVLGHRGDSKVNELFLGSTSESVVHRAKCAVLITK